MLKDHIDSAASSRLRSSTAIALALHSSVPTVRIPVGYTQQSRWTDLRSATVPLSQKTSADKRGLRQLAPAIAKWTVLLAAVAAPWVLLLT